MIVFLALCGPAGFSQQYCSDEMWRNIKALNDLHYYMKVKLVSFVLFCCLIMFVHREPSGGSVLKMAASFKK